MRAFQAAAIVSAFAGCSFIYTGDNLVGPGPDAGPNDGAINEGGGGDAELDASTDVFVDGISGVSSIAIDDAHVYWCTPDGRVSRRLRNNGTTNETIATGEQTPRFVAVSGLHVYWTAGTAIRRRGLDSGTPETFATATEEPAGLAFDRSGQFGSVYWSERSARRIRTKATLDGGLGEFTVYTDLDAPAALAAERESVFVVLGGGKLVRPGGGIGGQLQIEDSDTSSVTANTSGVYFVKPRVRALLRYTVQDSPSVRSTLVPGVDATAVASDGTTVYWAETSGRIRFRRF